MASMYSAKVMEHFANPHNVGEIPDANGVGEVGNPKCGDIMRMYLKIENNVIVDVKFLTFGCGAAIATSSMATDLIKGKTIDEALKLTNKAVVEALEGLPPIKVHCSVLAQAVKAALSDYYRRRATHAVGAFPCGLTGLCGLPHSKVGGVFLQVIVHAAAQFAVAAFQIVQLQVAQLAVAGVALHAEVHIAVLGNVSVAGVDQILDDIQNLGDMLGGTGLHGGLFAVQAGSILEVFGLEALSDRLHGGALLLTLLDELIVDIGDVGNVDHLVAPVFQIAAQGIEHDQRACVANVDIVVHGRAADIDAVFTGHLRHEFFLLAGQGVEDLHGQFSFLFQTEAAKQNAPGAVHKAQLRRRFFNQNRGSTSVCRSKPITAAHRTAILPHRGSRRVLSGRTLRSGLQTGFQPSGLFSLRRRCAALLCPDKRIYPFTPLL